jgi:hypothetical protein
MPTCTDAPYSAGDDTFPTKVSSPLIILLWTESILEEMSCLGAEVRLNHGLDDSNVDVSRHIVTIDTSILASSNVDRRE